MRMKGLQRTGASAQKYAPHLCCPGFLDSLRHLLATDPTIRTFDVHTYVSQKITEEKAA